MFSSDIILALASSSQDGQDGIDGKSLEFDWQGTQLGIRVEGEVNYTYVDLQGLKGDKGDKGDTGLQGATGLKGDKGDKGDSGANFIEVTPLSDSPATVTSFYYFTANISDGYPVNTLLVSGLHQSSSRSTQIAINEGGNQFFFRAAISSVWQPWAEVYNSRNLILGTLSHHVIGNFFSGSVGDYRYSDTPFQRYYFTFNAYSSPSSSSGYRFKNGGFAFWIDQRSSSGDVWFNTSGVSGNPGEQITPLSLFHFQLSTNRLLFYRKLNFQNLPTSSVGLGTGDVWRDSNGFLRII